VIGTFYTAGRNSFEAAENIWEGVFGIVASIIITLMGAALLRVSKLQDKWRVKISKVLESKDAEGLGERLEWEDEAVDGEVCHVHLAVCDGFEGGD
jgi:high-affinity Fe2+/Pb2+ permease